MPSPSATRLTLLGLLLLASCAAPGPAPATPDERALAEAHFERLKGLTGDWYLAGGVRLGVEQEANPDETFLSYAVSSGGHAVIEKLFVGQAGEMTSVYYLDEGRLRMDHYCSLGNQPRMVAIASEGDELTFELLGVDNMPDPDVLHISSHALEFTGPGELTVYWGATEDGEPSGGSMYQVRPLD